MGGRVLRLGLELSYYKVCCAVMEQCSYLAAGVHGNLGWWGYGRGRKPPKTGQNRVKVTRKGTKKPSQPRSKGGICTIEFV